MVVLAFDFNIASSFYQQLHSLQVTTSAGDVERRESRGGLNDVRLSSILGGGMDVMMLEAVVIVLAMSLKMEALVADVGRWCWW